MGPRSDPAERDRCELEEVMLKAKKRAGKPRKKHSQGAARKISVVKWRDTDSGGHFEIYLPSTWKTRTSQNPGQKQ
jgi:hypothetical protein